MIRRSLIALGLVVLAGTAHAQVKSNVHNAPGWLPTHAYQPVDEVGFD
jgi:hypothetical protein